MADKTSLYFLRNDTINCENPVKKQIVALTTIANRDKIVVDATKSYVDI